MLKRQFHRFIDRGISALAGVPVWQLNHLRKVRPQTGPRAPEVDLVYVLPPKHVRGWILDAICREIDRFTDARTVAVGMDEQLPQAGAYFYSHYGYFREVLLRQPDVLQKRNVLFYTHPRELWYGQEELIYCLNQADAIVSMCSMFANQIVREGVHRKRVEVGLVGADPVLFSGHPRGQGKVGFCSSYLPRKNGHRILELVEAMPETDFVLCGRHWEQWERFGQLAARPNFEYLQIPYSEYPSFYGQLDVFVSLSELEGGPVPLIEAAMSNVVPVCSETGHAADIIRHGRNGFVFDPCAPIAEVADLVKAAFELTADVRSTVEHLTWERFSRQVQAAAGLLKEKPAAAGNLREAA